MAYHPPRHRHHVQVVADGGQHVGVPHPVNVQRGAELRVILRGGGYRGEEGEPVLLISETGQSINDRNFVGKLSAERNGKMFSRSDIGNRILYFILACILPYGRGLCRTDSQPGQLL